MAVLFNHNVVFLSLAFLTVIASAIEVCNVCGCFPYEDDYFVVSCKNFKKHVVEIDFEDIEWPANPENYNYKAFFNKFSLNLLPKISGDSNVVSLNLDDNGIRTIVMNPFEYFMNLQELSIANNKITDLTKDFLKSQLKLRLLNLSNNTLTTLDPNVIAHLRQLQEINLSHNFLTKITADFLEATSHLEVIRLENNKIYAIDTPNDKVTHKLRKLFLTSNSFTVITSSMFEKLTNLEVIDLSDNKISNVDDGAFAVLTALKLLDLSGNSIKRVNLRLTDSLEIININNNNLNTWPLANIPENLTELELHHNNLESMFPNDENVPNVVRLDVSNNLIHQMLDTQFIKLEHLHLGFNLLKEIPQGINTKAPFLKELILDGNEISSIEFLEPTRLGSISLCNLTSLTRISDYALRNLTGIKVTSDETETCVHVRISQNENLKDIEPNAFHGVRFCDLDLSYNNLKTVPRNLTDWKGIDNGVNLQGNPLLCDCENEWILQDIMEALYDNVYHQELLMELKCQSPEYFKERRLVQFLHHDHPFCKEQESEISVHESGFGRFLPKISTLSDSNMSDRNIEFHLKPWSPGFLIVVALCSIILVLIVMIGVKWQRDQNRKLARRNRLYYSEY